MGRSQVLYNQRHNRPGSKGGRGQEYSQFSRKQGPPKPRGDNSWRVDAGDRRVTDVGVSEIESVNFSGPMYHIDGPNLERRNDAFDSGFTNGILNVGIMGRALSRISVADRLRTAPHLTEHLETLVAPMRPKEDIPADGSPKISPPVTDSKSPKKKDDWQDTNTEDEDLDSWLDTIIT